jgi:hypothetical protein
MREETLLGMLVERQVRMREMRERSLKAQRAPMMTVVQAAMMMSLNRSGTMMKILMKAKKQILKKTAVKNKKQKPQKRILEIKTSQPHFSKTQSFCGTFANSESPAKK